MHFGQSLSYQVGKSGDVCGFLLARADEAPKITAAIENFILKERRG